MGKAFSSSVATQKSSSSIWTRVQHNCSSNCSTLCCLHPFHAILSGNLCRRILVGLCICAMWCKNIYSKLLFFYLTAWEFRGEKAWCRDECCHRVSGVLFTGGRLEIATFDPWNLLCIPGGPMPLEHTTGGGWIQSSCGLQQLLCSSSCQYVTEITQQHS